jgi:hypothetical protein
MGFRYRKSFGSGPFRMTISKRGIGYSVGGKHLRVTKRADGRTQTTAHLAPGISYTASSHSGRGARTTTSSHASRPRTGLITPAASLRAQQVDKIAEFTALITGLHRRPYPQATEPEISPPMLVDRTALAVALSRQAAAGIPQWRFGARRAARNAALATVPTVAAEQDATAQAAYAQRVGQGQAEWRALLANDPLAVKAALDAAFADDEFSVATMVFAAGTAAIGLVYPGVDLIPESKPSTTAAGRPTLAKRTKTERNALYCEAISSAAIATVLKAHAAAPALTEVSVVVARHGGSGLEALYFGRFGAANMASFVPSQDPLSVMTAASIQGFATRGQAHDLVAITSAGDDELTAILTRTSNELAEHQAPSPIG